MPAASEPLVSLPHTWRPLGTRMVGLIAGLGLMAVCVASWIAMGAHLRAQFSFADRAMMLGLLAIAAAVWLALIRPRLSVSEQGVAVVNGYRRRDLEWAEVVAVRLKRGAPWAEMDLSDGTSIPVMAIQASDGDRARAVLRDFVLLVRAHTRTARND
ncbi:PH domain-containing protein [Nocardioides mangrovicus]|uniref:PH domain-containing protein n=1 Tax=Nocardioides mangrovicus TaxID=2478913 RepID=A0A3L8P6B5_9ACTN|nr:PH domain-containing protein [Nocardioides mangrovicus]RLV50243.1 PH domain-containing protein [Nocardioides mangrovicus]